MSRTTVPETAVDKDRKSPAQKGEVGLAYHVCMSPPPCYALLAQQIGKRNLSPRISGAAPHTAPGRDESTDERTGSTFSAGCDHVDLADVIECRMLASGAASVRERTWLDRFTPNSRQSVLIST